MPTLADEVANISKCMWFMMTTTVAALCVAVVMILHCDLRSLANNIIVPTAQGVKESPTYLRAQLTYIVIQPII